MSFVFSMLGMVALLLGGCATSRYAQLMDSGPTGSFNAAIVPDAIPKVELKSLSGNSRSYEVDGKTYKVLSSARGFRQRGVASWYGEKFHGYKTASGEIYNMYKMTAAHKTLPLPSYVRVTNLDNHRSVIVRVNDRGPFHKGRIIDLSYAAAKKLGYAEKGTANVEITSVFPPAKAEAEHKNKLVSPNKSSELFDGYGLYVQVGAFGLRTSALHIKKQLAKVTQNPVNVFEFDQNTTPLFRVWVGPFFNRREAMQEKKRISESGIGTPLIITRPIKAPGSVQQGES